MLDQVLETSKFVVENAKHVKIHYDKASILIEEIQSHKPMNYLEKMPYNLSGMKIKDIINFLLIYESVDFSFWGTPKWTIQTNSKELDGGNALFDCMFKLFEGRDSEEVYQELESLEYDKFKTIFKGNVELPLLKERYEIIKANISIVNNKMNGNFYEIIKNFTTDKEIFNFILEHFKSFEDTRIYKEKTIYFYKLAQLLTSDILHFLKTKENVHVDSSNLIGCADYKIPQLMQSLGILEYDDELLKKLENKIEIIENDSYEVEIRASMLVVIDYIWDQTNHKIDRIFINDFIHGKGQDKTINYFPYHLTRTTNY